MARTITVVTPENVRIEYELAGVASRGGAAIIDTMLQGLILLLMAAGRWFLAENNKWPGTTWANAVLWIGMFLTWWGYFVYFETVWNGQTPGKRYAKLRAVREGGLPMDLSSAAIRNLVGVIDFLPFLYMIGAVVMLFGSRSKRLGDIAAGTLVVKERSESLTVPLTVPHVQPASLGEAPRVKNIELVSPDEFEAAKQFVERMPELEKSVRSQLAARIAGPILLKLGIADDGQMDHCALLKDIYSDCVQFRGMR